MRDLLIALVALVVLAAVLVVLWRIYLRRQDDQMWLEPEIYAPDDLDDDSIDEAWADELHAMPRDLPGPAEARSDRAGEHHCGICGQAHDDETRLDPGWFGRWEVEQAEWMAGFRADRDAVQEWMAAA